jgi:hypothetical protein
VFERLPAEVLAVELDQIEGAQYGGMIETDLYLLP